MPKLPVFNGKELIKFLEYLGFQVTRTKGSHSRLISEEGKATSVPVHANKDSSGYETPIEFLSLTKCPCTPFQMPSYQARRVLESEMFINLIVYTFIIGKNGEKTLCLASA
jgi:predicted RNA binding protein YcfA (HicA-like mRNA interferase family)